MPDPEKGQSQTPEKPKTFDEYFSKGWDQVEEIAPELGKQASPPPAPEKKTDEECPDCPPGQKKPFKVLKVDGKPMPVYSEQELIELAQKGFDYTKKTQALAEERKKITSEPEPSRAVMERLAKIEQMLQSPRQADASQPAGQAPPAAKPQTPEQQAAERSKIFAEYGLEEEYASDFEKKLVDDVYKVKQDNENLRSLTQLIVVQNITKSIAGSLEEAVQEFPVEDVQDERGQSITGAQVISVFKELVTDERNKDIPVRDLAKMAVKTVHDYQKKGNGGAEPKPVRKEMTVEEFAKEHPELYAQIRKQGGQEAVAEFAEDQSQLPPSIKGRKAEVPSDGDGKDKKRKFKTVAEAIDAGMNDPEIAKLFGG